MSSNISNCGALMKKGTDLIKGMRYCPSQHLYSSPGNSVAQYAGNWGTVKALMLAISVWSGSSSGDHFHPLGWMSSSAAPSRKPHVCTLPGIADATASTANA
jgi:hypothetical protein